MDTKILELPVKDKGSLKALQALTEPKFQCCLLNKQPNDISKAEIIAIAAYLEEKPIGLILASFFTVIRIAEIHSLFVVESERHHSVGDQLMTELESELKKRDCGVVTFVYEDKKPFTAYLERILEKHQWGPPRPFSIHCRFDAHTFQPDWLRRDYVYSSNFHKFPWKELTKKERAKLALQDQKGYIPASVSPFHDEKRIEYINSLGLRYKGEVIGWVVTHRTDPDTIRYTALYIHYKHQIRGDAIKLLCESMWRHKASGVHWAVIDINLVQSSPRWIKFVERRLIPLAQSVSYKRHSWKELRKGV